MPSVRSKGVVAGDVTAGAGTMTNPSVPSVVRRLFGDHEPQLVWTNECSGLTFRAGNRFVKWNPRATGLDLNKSGSGWNG